MTPDDQWLAAVWPFVHAQLPVAPAMVAEVGCGPLGGFVPMLRAAGYDAIGVDPAAPQKPGYHQVEFERNAAPEPAGAIVACTSLHHVANLVEVLDLVNAALAPAGVLVVVEWARERFDEATARWCCARLPADNGDPSWLQQLCGEWQESGQPWDVHCRRWAEEERLHTGQDILRELGTRFDATGPVSYGPYFFPDLAGMTEQDEQAATAALSRPAAFNMHVGVAATSSHTHLRPVDVPQSYSLDPTRRARESTASAAFSVLSSGQDGCCTAVVTAGDAIRGTHDSDSASSAAQGPIPGSQAVCSVVYQLCQ